MRHWYESLDPTTKGAVIGAVAVLVGGFIAAFASYAGAARAGRLTVKLGRQSARLQAHRELLLAVNDVLGRDVSQESPSVIGANLRGAAMGVRLVDVNRADEAKNLADVVTGYAAQAAQKKLAYEEMAGTALGLSARQGAENYARVAASEVQGRLERFKLWRRGKTTNKQVADAMDRLAAAIREDTKSRERQVNAAETTDESKSHPRG